MGISWSDYDIYDPGFLGLPADLSRQDAKDAFSRLMAARKARRVCLGALLRANEVALFDDDASVQRLNGWYLENVSEDPDRRGRLLPEWYSVVNDIGLYLGDIAIKRHAELRWELYVSGKKDVSYQRHVLMGFTRVSNPKFNFDLDGGVAGLGHRVVAGLPADKSAFARWLGEIDKLA